ncbi:MAG TPA: hypothetical protein VF628_03505 [Allosphingosinicella sp.]|jgi:hypothetical protein
MCLIALALSASAMPCLNPEVQMTDRVTYTTAAPGVQARRLSNPELDRIRGGWAVLTRTGPDGVIRLVRDGNTRDMTMTLPPGVQMLDNWFAEVGSAYIAASLSRP